MRLHVWGLVVVFSLVLNDDKYRTGLYFYSWLVGAISACCPVALYAFFGALFIFNIVLNVVQKSFKILNPYKSSSAGVFLH